MHIVDIPAYYFPHQGGIEMVAYAYCKEWVGMGHESTIVSTQTDNAPLKEICDGINIIRVPSLNALKVPWAFGMGNALRALHKEKTIDIVRLHYPHPIVLDFARKTLESLNIPFILHMHGKEIIVPGVLNIAAQFYNKHFLTKACERASRITSSTKKLFDQSKLLKPYSEKMCFVSAGVDEKWDPDIKTTLREEMGLSGKTIILSFGVLRDYKGINYLIEAMEQIKNSNVILIVAGDGPERIALEELTKTKGLKNRIIFTGFVPEERKKEYFALADIFCMPSPDIREGFGLVAADAIVMNTPCVVTKGAGISELFQELDIPYVTEAKSPLALSSRI